MGLLIGMSLFSMFFFNTLFLQRVLGYSALEAGLAFLPFTAGIIIGSVASQSLIPKLGAREVPVIGLGIAAGRWSRAGGAEPLDLDLELVP